VVTVRLEVISELRSSPSSDVLFVGTSHCLTRLLVIIRGTVPGMVSKIFLTLS
jgi:hypothetical protein